MSNSICSTSPVIPTNITKIFKSDQHGRKITRKLLKFYLDKQFFDIIIKAGKEDSTEIQAHKIVLSAASEYFYDLFHKQPETTSKTIEIPLIEGSSLKQIINYMYSGIIDLNLEKIDTLLEDALYLEMKDLIAGCSRFMEENLNTANCLRWLPVIWDEPSLIGLREKLYNFIYANFEEAIVKTEFYLLDKDNLKDLLINMTKDDLGMFVFRCLYFWINYDKPNRKHLEFELLSSVQYKILSSKCIIKNVKYISTKVDENCDLVHSWLKYHLTQEELKTNDQDQGSTLICEPTTKEDVDKVQVLTESNKKVDKIEAIYFNFFHEADIKSYNRELKTWIVDSRSPSSFVDIKIKRHYSMIVIDDKLYVVGGVIDLAPQRNVTCINLKTFEFTALPPLRNARQDCQLANLNGNLCVFGGCGRTMFIDTVEIFNNTTQEWKIIKPPYKPNTYQKVTGHNGILYIFDFHYGSLHCYDISLDKWTIEKFPIDDNVLDFRITSSDDCLYGIFIGKKYEENNQSFKKTEVKRYDLVTKSWFKLAKLDRNNSTFHKVTIHGNRILFISNECKIVEYDLGTKEFTYLTDLSDLYYDYHILPLKL
ncbi:kelch-like protein 5 [Episyrphus balteatus]|uniref:kelch-like protein 5 n=1 Tax=Episyrphus balteatus TaxID=286459 RepID=UPI00248559E6|nr:kelch-like protein 5 [Episyrphus balteatus]